MNNGASILMVIFQDQDKRVRVVRMVSGADGKVARETLGSVLKRDLQIPPELVQQLNREELAQLQKALEIYQSARTSLLRYQAQNFPVIVREVIDYFEASTDEVERSLIAAAVLEALRRIRAGEREQTKPPMAAGKESKAR
jgi:hypothetical protein